MIKCIFNVPYIVATAVLLGIILPKWLPIWTVDWIEPDRGKKMWKGFVTDSIQKDVRRVGNPATKKCLTYIGTRPLHYPRMPCDTVVWLN